MKLLPPPGPARTKQLALLGFVLVAGAFALWRLTGTEPAITSSATSNSPARAVTTAEPVKTLPQPIQLGKLESTTEAPETSRNPFRFGTRPPPPAPPAPARVAPISTPAPPPGPPPPPRVDPITLNFIGRIVMPDKRVVAALSDGKGSVIQGTEGQVIDGRYRLVKIGEESLIIEYVNGTGRTVRPLKGGS